MALFRPTPDPVGPGQESVWSYPRPPRLELSSKLVEIWLGDVRIASTGAAFRVLETSHPPTYYLPRDAFVPGSLEPAAGTSMCEWKGAANYIDVVGGGVRAARAGWTYLHPTPAFAVLAGYVSVYPAAMQRCTVDSENVRAQPGRFYGGWVTDEIVGPFKGIPGSNGW
jgi:uncharacterized protein (DUF427 family)